jgi:uncharacterized protein (DUF3820 family)
MVMPFGKHKGKLLADLPGNYLTWFAREGFPKGEIGRLLALMHEIDHNGLADLLKPLRSNLVHSRQALSQPAPKSSDDHGGSVIGMGLTRGGKQSRIFLPKSQTVSDPLAQTEMKRGQILLLHHRDS